MYKQALITIEKKRNMKREWVANEKNVFLVSVLWIIV